MAWASITVSAGVRTKVVTIRGPAGSWIRATVRVPEAVFSASMSKPAPALGYTTCPPGVFWPAPKPPGNTTCTGPAAVCAVAVTIGGLHLVAPAPGH
ncbi:hypothetical protein, partial [Mycolicibacterium fortuitum]|uniref:hypothetical protein n=1 Tax=Mycolicibacterium fortuitum TaxID=1766 RepID=UPI001A97091F